jgi:very-short-patch-repair endonuclease
MDPASCRSKGAQLLRNYIDYAERGVSAIVEAVSVNEMRFDSPFEEEVYAALTARGLQLHSQVGCSGYRIDLAVQDPNTPGRYILGIECDGAAYHSAATARDRDRLRQQVLERLGWKIHRIWSRDWINNRQLEIEKILATCSSYALSE